MSNTSTQLTIGAASGISFFDVASFEFGQRVAAMFSKSSLVPPAFANNIPNCTIALDIAQRTGSSPIMVMQNLNIIHNKPSWSSQYIIAAINACGKFTPLRYEVTDLGELDVKGVKLKSNKVCVAYSWERTLAEAARTKENRLESAPVSCEMAVLEGWWGKSGSKWPIMTDLMLRYRAATLFGRMYAPDILMGMRAEEEVQDIIDVTPPDAAVARLEERMQATPETDGSKPRRTRGAAAAAANAAKPAEPIDVAPAAEPEPAPAADAAPGVSNPPTPPAPVAPNSVKVRVTVKSAVEVPSNGKLFTKAQLEGDEFTGEAFYENPLIKFAADGALIEATIERREHKTKPGTYLNVIAAYEVLA